MPDGTWVDLIPLAALEPGDATPARLGGRRLAVHDTPDGPRVTDARCSHAGADLCDGYLDGHLIECPLHQGLFDVRTGEARGRPATRPIGVFPCRAENGMVRIRIDRARDPDGPAPAPLSRPVG